jgi:outer membrane protein assembly factor BamB
MSDDFVSRLRLELRAAAEREARRGPVRRAARAARWDLGSPPVVAAAALIVAVVIAVAAGGALRDTEAPPPTGTRPHVVAEMQLVQSGGPLDVGFGSVWAADNATGELLRLDASTRRVEARFQVGGAPFVRAVGGAMWATAEGRLLRIDPSTNRVTARIDLSLSPTLISDVFPGRGVVWVITPLELIAVDPRRDAITRRIDLAGDGFQVASFAYDARSIYVGRSDGWLQTHDARTGVRVSRMRMPADAAVFAAVDDRLLVGTETTISALDAATGRVVWQRKLGARRLNNAAIDDPLLWVHGTDGKTGRDRIWRMDVESGRITGSVALREFGVAGITAVGDEVWSVSPSGRLVVVR